MLLNNNTTKIVNSIVLANHLKLSHTKILELLKKLIANGVIDNLSCSVFEVLDDAEKVVTYQINGNALSAIQNQILESAEMIAIS